MIAEAMPTGTSDPGRLNHAGLVKGKGTDNGQPLPLQAGVWVWS